MYISGTFYYNSNDYTYIYIHLLFALHNFCLKLSHATSLQLELYCVNQAQTRLHSRKNTGILLAHVRKCFQFETTKHRRFPLEQQHGLNFGMGLSGSLWRTIYTHLTKEGCAMKTKMIYYDGKRIYKI
jgi:hypothetical protein